MKNIVTCLFLFLLFAGCEKDLPGFSGEEGVIFSMNPSKDSIVYSFAFYPGTEIGEVKIPVEIMGNVAQQERTYKYEIASRSTAREGIDYQKLPLQGTIAAGRVTDTIVIRFINHPDMESNTYALFLTLLPSDDFVVGLPTNALAKVYVSNRITQPKWWDDWYTDNVLGAYSDKKYRYFIEITGESDLEALELYKMRTTVLKFKYHIEELKTLAEQETDAVKKAEILEKITEEDGTIMNIPLKGALPDRDEEE